MSSLLQTGLIRCAYPCHGKYPLRLVFWPNGYFPWVGNESSFLVTDPLVG